MDQASIFSITSKSDFEEKALTLFGLHWEHNPFYREFCDYLNAAPTTVSQLKDIPFLPITFFKSKTVQIQGVPQKNPVVFSSSGTTGSVSSKHYVPDIGVYESSFRKAFSLFYGSPEDYRILALLPAYLERQGSSLVYMAQDLIQQSKHPESGFYLNNRQALAETLSSLEAKSKPSLLIGVSFALLDLATEHPMALTNTIVMETGGMKGRKKEMVREELHHYLKKGFGLKEIHSEYGMTELLSQAYSKGNGRFFCPPWMQVLIRDPEDPLTLLGHKKTGGINVIDLANIHSCPFIATQDLGRTHSDNSFEVLGRFDHSDVRGCNLMAL